MREKKQLCSDPDCFSVIVIDSLIERMADGTPHKLALKCYKCCTPEDLKKLKAFRKRRRKAKCKKNNLIKI